MSPQVAAMALFTLGQCEWHRGGVTGSVVVVGAVVVVVPWSAGSPALGLIGVSGSPILTYPPFLRDEENIVILSNALHANPLGHLEESGSRPKILLVDYKNRK